MTTLGKTIARTVRDRPMNLATVFSLASLMFFALKIALCMLAVTLVFSIVHRQKMMRIHGRFNAVLA
jgi:hypothetical protein